MEREGRSPASLTSKIRSRAFELGFDKIGVTPARRAARSEAFRAWLDHGFHGEMGYLARDPAMRADPRRRDEWARSVVCVAMSYLPAGSERSWSGAAGILPGLSRYAVGEDYHEVIGGRLKRLLAFVQSEAPGSRGRMAVDTSPLLEREFAETSGLGWLAKNTMILDGEIGSWTFLGELVLDLELEYDAAPEDRCGTCRACIDACPTGAILPIAPERSEGSGAQTLPREGAERERMLDATRCISYLNIELKGAIPADRRADLGSHLFGCDVCQEVCPWNRHARPSSEAAFEPRPAYARLSLAEVASMSEHEFREVFSGSAIRRAKRRGLVRNALIVGANTSDEHVLAAARDALLDSDPVVRAAAAWSLGKGGAPASRSVLEAALSRETDKTSREEIRSALDELGAGS